MLAIGSAVAKGASGIFGSIAGHNDKIAQARAQNQAMMDQYKYQLQIRDRKYKQAQQVYATKSGQYDLQMKAADRAAARAYGAEQYNQSQRVKSAAFKGLQLSQAFLKGSGAAAAAGKTGRSAARLDRNIEGAFVRNQATLAANLLQGAEVQSMREMGIQDQLQSRYNQLYGNVAVAPSQPMAPLAPQMRSGPNPMGMMLGIGSSLVSGYQQYQDSLPPAV